MDGIGPTTDIKTYFEQLRTRCEAIFASSMSPLNLEKVAKSHLFVYEINRWCEVLIQRRESELLKLAALEFEFALLALMQGYYRHAFKGLRLVLELILQTVYLSTNELRLREWLDNRSDTVWNAIVNKEEGIFSTRFAKAFFPELSKHIQHYRGLAEVVYRECSECVHGNIPKEIPLPTCLEFNKEVFDIWHSKASNVVLIAHFILSLRYLSDILEDKLTELEPFLSDHLGHIEDIRMILGGPTKG